MSTGRKACTFCLEPDVMEIRFDKNGKPYAICQGCGARAFFRGSVSFRGVLFVDDFVRQCADIREFQRKIDTSGKTLVPVVMPTRPAAVEQPVTTRVSG